MTQWEYVKGSEADFEGCDSSVTQIRMRKADGKIYRLLSTRLGDDGLTDIIAQRQKVHNLQSRANDANLGDALKEMFKPTGIVKVETRAPSKEESDAYNKRFDTVQRPAHYNQSGIECIDAIAAAVKGKSGIEASLVGNVIKYLWRYELKNGVEDVQKAQWYLERLVKELSK